MATNKSFYVVLDRNYAFGDVENAELVWETPAQSEGRQADFEAGEFSPGQFPKNQRGKLTLIIEHAEESLLNIFGEIAGSVEGVPRFYIEIARALGYNEETIAYLCKHGELPKNTYPLHQYYVDPNPPTLIIGPPTDS